MSCVYLVSETQVKAYEYNIDVQRVIVIIAYYGLYFSNFSITTASYKKKKKLWIFIP